MIENDTILDCVIIALVRSSFHVKLSHSTIFVNPYSTAGQYGRGSCMVTVENGEVIVRGETRTSLGGVCHGDIYQVSLSQPHCFDELTREIQRYFQR